jgi:hypothetical protein
LVNTSGQIRKAGPEKKEILNGRKMFFVTLTSSATAFQFVVIQQRRFCTGGGLSEPEFVDLLKGQ